MAVNRARAYKRWVCMTLEWDCSELCADARTLGVQIIDGYRGALCMWSELALWATPSQMKGLEERWTARGLKWKRNGRYVGFGISTEVPRERWAEFTVDWSKARGAKAAS